MKKINLLLLVMGIFFCVKAQQFKEANSKDIALFPQQNGIRNTLNLSGIWKFQKDPGHVGEKELWFNGLKNSRSIAVPGSWNEQYDDSRDYLDLAWYEKETFIPATWKGQRIYIRIGSANYAAKIWINGKPLGQHAGGHLPFAFEISSLINWNRDNRITISVENILKPSRVPTGGQVATSFFSSFPKANFDFFPFAGLNRAVWLYALPAVSSIKDITVKSSFVGSEGNIDIVIEREGTAKIAKVVIIGDNKTYEATVSFSGASAKATIQIPSVRKWSPGDPFLYKVEVNLVEGKRIVDYYELNTGVRTIAANNKQILLNGEPVFLKGFGKHEDFPIFGRGTAYPVIVKDYSLLKWVGANSYRTSHYPYDEEYMEMADREGILIIDEIPAVGLYFHGDADELKQRQAACKQYIEELITRDKNHPSVIMWSIANEPFPPNVNLSPTDVKVAEPNSLVAFKELFDLVKQKDDTRLKTLVGVMGGPVEWLGLADVVCINRYWGWYTNPGDIATGAAILSKELDELHSRLNKPIIVTEFGADTYPGMHAEQAEMFTEEYQTEFIKAYLDVADSKYFVSGMHVWAFSDFKTGQGVIRFGGVNYKGVFTRDRKPKMSAHYLRSRWNTNKK